MEDSSDTRTVRLLRRMHSEAARTDALPLLLRRIARHVGGQAALLDASGRLLHAAPQGTGLVEHAAEAMRRSAGARSVTVREHGHTVAALPIGEGDEQPVLLVAGEDAAVRDRGLLTDAARLLWLSWQAEAARRHRARLDRADIETREAVLHLLMLGQAHAARRVAAALGQPLPDPLRVSVVESTAPSRDAVAAVVGRCTGGQAWVVRCQIYTGHLIVLTPPATELDRAMRDGELAGARVRSGTSQVIGLRDLPTGYEQAFHALALARAGGTREATFDAGADLAATLGSAGYPWAVRLLRPLLDYVPDRPQDPGSAELQATLRSWLSFHQRAAAQLRIHRNTLAARLRRIERLLGCDVRRLDTQARLHLALRLLAYRHGAPDGPAPGLASLLDPAVAGPWAKTQLDALPDRDPRLVTTVRTWLSLGADIDATACALDVSPRTVRKRLHRVEATLGRSLLHGPSARCDLYLALVVSGS